MNSASHKPLVSRIEIDAASARAVLRGHPWIWRSAINSRIPAVDCGAVVSVHSRGPDFVAYALYDPESPIALRVYGTHPDQPLDLALLTQMTIRAIALRDRMFQGSSTNAMRLVNGEGDRIPGVVLDRYANVVVGRYDGNAIRPWFDPLLKALWPSLKERGVDSVVTKTGGNEANLRTVAGSPPPDSVEIVEHGMRMDVDLVHGQKTGAFLDQRENRRRVRDLSASLRVLNLFSYTGGFSCASALGGAAHVTSVDIAHGAHNTAQRSFLLNGLDPSCHAFVTADAFCYLDEASKRSQQWDMIISDPPSFAHNEKSVSRALAAYRRLHAACAKCLAPGGLLCAASCSSHVSMEIFLQTLDDDALGRGRFVMLEAHGQPADHPTVPFWPEGRYLKFVVMRDCYR